MKIFVIPDVQSKPGVSPKFLNGVGRYIADKQPDHVVCIGDFADMSSLSSYDKGKKAFEGRRYIMDIDAAELAMSTLRLAMDSNGPFKGQMHMLYGNHEDRIDRAVENQPELEGTLGLEDLAYKVYGWKTYPFLVPMSLGGVVFCHYFVSGAMGRPIATAQRLISTKHQSCIAGHQQGKQVAYGYRGDGKAITSIIAGSCYEHNEAYMGPQGNKHWRGMIGLHEVKDGEFDEMFVSLNYLRTRYK